MAVIGVALVCAACTAAPHHGTTGSAHPGQHSSSPRAGQASGAYPASSAPSTTPTAGKYLVRRWDIGTQPCAVVGGFGSIWIALYGDDKVVRLDPRTGRVRARISTDDDPCGLAIGAGSVWVENYRGNTVDRINVSTNRVQKEIPVGSAPYDVTFAAGAAWVTNFGDGTVTRIDAATYRTRTVRVGYSPIGIARADGAVWVPNRDDGTVSRIDTATLRTTTLQVGGAPGWTAYDGDNVWVANNPDHAVQRIDAGSGRVVARIPLTTTTDISDGDVLDGRVYFPCTDGTVYVIDERTNRQSGAYPSGLAYASTLAAYDGRLWLVDYQGTELEELDPTLMH